VSAAPTATYSKANPLPYLLTSSTRIPLPPTRPRQHIGTHLQTRHVRCSAAINAPSCPIDPPPAAACRLRSPHRPRPPSSRPEHLFALRRAQFSPSHYVADAEHVVLPNTLADPLKQSPERRETRRRAVQPRQAGQQLAEKRVARQFNG
jgi:hypothetical protein